MSRVQFQDRGLLRVDENECKGCGLCIESCPKKVIFLSDGLNHSGYRTAAYAGAGCAGCGICFLACPEPGAIIVLRLRANLNESVIPIKGATQCAGSDEG
jgi:NAD-dependent dihydropyrimidine dehydrogenase PreA subunit